VKQKRLAFVLIVVSLLVIAYGVNKILIRGLKAQPSPIDQTTLSLQQKLDQYRATQLQQKPAEPPKLDPKIINRELEKVGQLIVFKGQMIYNEPVENKGFLWQRRLELQLTYNYGIGIDLSLITVEEVAPNVVTLKIPKSEVKLVYVELDANNSVVNETKTMLVKSFTSEETRFILGYVQDETNKRIKADKDIYNKSVESLKANLEQLVMKLGFKKVIVVEV
jgi:hypothetical protein